MQITGKQIAMARILLDLSQQDLADALGVARKTILRIENEQSPGSTKTLEVIQRFFENHDVVFTGERGVNQVKNDIKTYTDQEGFDAFYQDFYSVLEQDKRVVCLSNSEERDFEKYFGDGLESHIQKIVRLGVRYRILIKDNDETFMTPEYAEYRWMPEDYYASVPFFVFGDKLAIFLFEDNLKIIVIHSPPVADAYRMQFKSFWESAKIPPTA